MGVIMCGMWSLWRSRNDRRHGKIPINPGKALAWVIETCYQLISGKQINSQTMSRQVKHWQLPGEVTVKINVDGAYHHKSNSGATRVVMCNNCGAMLAASA